MTGDKQDSIWPLPRFYFEVDFGAIKNVPFQEVNGLETETQVIEYRATNSKVFSTIKMPGIAKVGNVTLKKGVFAKDNDFFNWYNEIKLNVIERQEVIIKLLDEGGSPTMVWTLTNAYPCKIQGTDLKADGSKVAIETIELAFDTFKVDNK